MPRRRRRRVLITPYNDMANFFFNKKGSGSKLSLNGFVPQPNYS